MYSKNSPYARTAKVGNYLGVWNSPTLVAEPDDIEYEIQLVYEHRPQLLANDLYGDPALWWVFAMRNPNKLRDPVYDFAAGTIIHLPKKANISKMVDG